MKLGAEDKIQLSILDYLDLVLPEALVFHVPNQGLRSLTTGKKFKLLGMRAGVPDLVMIHRGVCFFIEIKSPKGVVSPAQKDFCEAAGRAGAGWVVARCVEDVRNALRLWNIPTREAMQ